MRALRGGLESQNKGEVMTHMHELQEAQQSDERLCYEIAARLDMAKLDGYLTDDEFQHVLRHMGILTNWKRSRNGNGR